MTRKNFDFEGSNFITNLVATETLGNQKGHREGFTISKYHDFHFNSEKKGQLVALKYVDGNRLSKKRTFCLLDEQGGDVIFLMRHQKQKDDEIYT